jgi:hypothetical protein
MRRGKLTFKRIKKKKETIKAFTNLKCFLATKQFWLEDRRVVGDMDKKNERVVV